MNEIRVRGAQEHNLRNVSLDVPRDRLTVFTGVSGSGKSSLAFDTIYKEGRRRFLESLPSYARRFLGGFEKPKVERIEGLSPAISIEQKTISASPRSTVGTITEIHDHLRLLFARLGVPHCHQCAKPVHSQTADQVTDQILFRYPDARALLCAPIVRERKGEFRREFANMRRDGFTRVRVDGEVLRLGEDDPPLERSKSHSIDIVYDRIRIAADQRSRIVEGIEKCFGVAEDLLRFVVVGDDGKSVVDEKLFSGRFACADCGVDLPPLEPRLFSFNSPHGACTDCTGLGVSRQIDSSLIVADPSRAFIAGGLAVFGARKKWLLTPADQTAFEAFAKKAGFSTNSSLGDLSEENRSILVEGGSGFVGLRSMIEAARRIDEGNFEELTRELPCRACEGARLGVIARAVRFRDFSLSELCGLSLEKLQEAFEGVQLEGADEVVGTPILREISSRLRFLQDVGLSYLTLSRGTSSLSGGEAQRIRLASQVGAGLQGVCYVLDEPSIGLHPRDQKRLLETLHRLREIGNTVLVVEHDEETIASADHVVDLGPGAGSGGGEITAEGSPESLCEASGSVTGDYLSGRRRIQPREEPREVGQHWLELYGVRHNNVDGLDARIPLEVFVAVTGVSGSGKSTLINQVLRPALLRKKNIRRGEDPGAHRSLRGYQHVDKLIDINQSPIGKSPRSNPATYTKLFSLIRDLFAKLPEARARGYSAGRFSFNVKGGRCEECGGAGVTVVDMQFLAPVEIVCEACGGERYNRETLEILYRGKSIRQVLEQTVSDARAFFQDIPRIHSALKVLEGVGLGYITLGQSSTTLSGGEAQRLKLATELLKKETGHTLYIFDEPTTGLHFEDVRVLLDALHELVDRGNSVIVIEHHLDVIRTSDWVIDLGPEAGDAGGQIVAEGPPLVVAEVEGSHTGRALRELGNFEPVPSASGPRKDTASDDQPLVIRGASEHNLRSVDVDIPRGKMTVVTGVSGSGKSTLAFDTIFAEGQRRYIESLSTYARQFLGRMRAPQVDRIEGLSPSIAIDQRSVLRGHRSTVATTTEIHEYLRLLFARVGVPHCPDCSAALEHTTPTRLAGELVSKHVDEKLWVLCPADVQADVLEFANFVRQMIKEGFTRIFARGTEWRLDEEEPDTVARRIAGKRKDRDEDEPLDVFVVIDRAVVKDSIQTRLADSLASGFERGGGRVAVRIGENAPAYYSLTPTCPEEHFAFSGQLTPRMFSFNSFEGACERCRGTGVEKRACADRIVAQPDAPVLEALDAPLHRFLTRYRTSALQLLRGFLRQRGIDERSSFSSLSKVDQNAIYFGSAEVVVLELPTGSYETEWKGLLTLLNTWQDEDGDNFERFGLDRFFARSTCTSCDGRRLRRELLSVLVGGLDIHSVTGLTIEAARSYFAGLELAGSKLEIARDVLREIENRLRFLENVGLGYLSLDRPSATLSGGESQRIRLASQLGNRLVGVLYVLDEPTIGLHPRDTEKLLASLEELRDQGNTVILVEHDRDTMCAADKIIDMGPGAGDFGGEVVAAGTFDEILSCEKSITAKYLRGDLEVAPIRDRRPRDGGEISLRGINCHNLQGIDVDFPLGVLTVVTGVSGSGKSSLVMDVLANALKAENGELEEDAAVASVSGVESIQRSVVVDQRPLGRTPKSTPATYSGVWGPIRDLYASLTLSKTRGYSAGRFSFNSAEGRCQACEGHGAKLVEMHFLSDVWVQCEVCRGQRYDEATREVLFKGLSISEVLELTIEAATEHFENQPRVYKRLKMLDEVGLGYVKLGQPASTLSGGEAQRVKLATELVDRSTSGNLYILDEPTTGLHFDDVSKLVRILHRLVDGGNTVIVIEHHLDVIASADWVLELGPEAGARGGEIVASGTPEVLAESEGGHTGRFLADVINRKRGGGVLG